MKVKTRAKHVVKIKLTHNEVLKLLDELSIFSDGLGDWDCPTLAKLWNKLAGLCLSRPAKKAPCDD